MNRKTVLVASYHLWDWPFKAGMHFLTEYFINRGCKVGFITIPFSLLSFTSTYSRKNRLPGLIKVWLKGGEKQHDGMFIWYAPLTLFHPTSRMPTLFNFLNSKRATKEFLRLSLPPLKFWLRKHGFDKPDLLIFESGECMSIYGLVKAGKVIYRVSDNPKDLGKPSGVLDLERKIVREADIILPVSKPIYDIIVGKRGTKEGVHLLRNGVDIALFKRKTSMPKEYLRISEPRAVYVGSTGDGLFDFNLILYAAKELPKVSFVIIGPCPPISSSDNKIPPNIYFLGTKPHPQLPGYLQYADVGLIPFKNVDRLEYPLKFYEYIACGLPVISVGYGALKAMSPYALLANSYEEFVRMIKVGLEVDNNHRSELKKTARKFSWDAVFEKIDKIISQELGWEIE